MEYLDLCESFNIEYGGKNEPTVLHGRFPADIIAHLETSAIKPTDQTGVNISLRALETFLDTPEGQLIRNRGLLLQTVNKANAHLAAELSGSSKAEKTSTLPPAPVDPGEGIY